MALEHARSEMDLAASFRPISLDRYIGRWVFLNFCSDDFDPENTSEDCTGPPDDDDLDDFDNNKAGSVAQLPDGRIDMHDHDIGAHTLVPSNQCQKYCQEAFPSLQFKCFEHPLAPYMEVEGSLLDYFIRGVSPQCSLAPTHNPYLNYVTPLCFHHESVRNAILAAAANQLCILGDSRFQKEAFLYKQRTLTGLREEIAAGNLNEGTLATVLMLCFRDVRIHDP